MIYTIYANQYSIYLCFYLWTVRETHVQQGASKIRHKPHPNTVFTERSFTKQGRKVQLAAF